MRNISIVVLVVLSSGAGFWLGQARAVQRNVTTTGPSLNGNINLVFDKDSWPARNVVLSNSRAVDGDLQMRSLPNGKIALAGDLHVRPN